MDLAKCLTSGQVFRWKFADGFWVGVDGENTYRLEESFGFADIERSEPLRELFRVDWDYGAILGELEDQAPELKWAIANARGLRLMRPSCPRETLFSFLCTSNNHLSRITSMVEKLAGYGEPLAEGQTRFPTLERIASISEKELRDAGFGYRGATIPQVARQILERGGEGWLAQMRNVPYEQVHTELITLPGVGPKLADCIALYAFDHTEATPTDTHLWQAVTRTYFPEWVGSSLTDMKRRHVGAYLRDRFGKRAGLVQQLLFYENLTLSRAASVRPSP